MKHIYDLFEKFPDGSSLWRACVMGLDGARMHVADLAKRSPNKFYALHVMSGKLVSFDLGPGALSVSRKIERRSSVAAA
jgi:hypothetical protein